MAIMSCLNHVPFQFRPTVPNMSLIAKSEVILAVNLSQCQLGLCVSYKPCLVCCKCAVSYQMPSQVTVQVCPIIAIIAGTNPNKWKCRLVPLSRSMWGQARKKCLSTLKSHAISVNKGVMQKCAGVNQSATTVGSYHLWERGLPSGMK